MMRPNLPFFRFWIVCGTSGIRTVKEFVRPKTVNISKKGRC